MRADGQVRCFYTVVAFCFDRFEHPVFLHGRSQAAMKEAASNLPKGPGSAIVVGVGADLSSFADVRAFVKAVLAHPDSKKLSLLLFNAGIGNPPNSDVRSADGFDFITQSNYLSHELMFSLLQPIVSANRGTVVHTSSGVASLVPFLTHSEITDFKKSVNVMV